MPISAATCAIGLVLQRSISRLRPSIGWRIHGRDSDQAKSADRAKSAGARTGYTYLHSAIDGFSRLSYTDSADAISRFLPCNENPAR